MRRQVLWLAMIAGCASPPAPRVLPVPRASLVSPATTASVSPSPPPLPVRAERLLRLARIWGDVRFLHPAVVEGAVDWDAALVAALPGALAAETDDEEIAALRTLLEALHDPATRIEKPAQ